MNDWAFKLAVISGCASIIALLFAMVDTWRQHRFRAFLGFVVFVVFAGFATWALSSQPSDRPTRLLGLLESARGELASAVRDLSQRRKMENGGFLSLQAPPYPKILGEIARDGDAFNRLSAPMKEAMPIFVKQAQAFDEGYREAAGRGVKSQAGTIALMLLAYSTQTISVDIELTFQRGEITEDEHSLRFGAAQGFDALSMLTGDLDTGVAPESKPITSGNMISESDIGSAFWAGHDLCLGAAQFQMPLSAERNSLLDRAQSNMGRLGVILNLHRLVDMAASDPRKQPLIEELATAGLMALYGSKLAATFRFGAAVSPTLDSFHAYLTDAQFRTPEHWDAITRDGLRINAMINDVYLPDELKRRWGKTYMAVIAGLGWEAPHILRWKQDIISYYGGLSSREATARH